MSDKSSEQSNEQQVVDDSAETTVAAAQSGDQNPNPGDKNQNPAGISFIKLIAEDFRTYDKNLLEPGFWAVVIHRYGNWRMDIKPRLLRIPFSIVYKILHIIVQWLWGIDLEYSVKLGRRVRLWHHGGMVLGAASIGDDVTIRHNTTMGILHKHDKWKKPIIEDRVDIGVGACILGDVIVRHDTVIGANSVVVRSFPAHSTLFGVPARPVNLKPKGES